MTEPHLPDIKARLDAALKTASTNHALRLGPALYDAFQREGWFVDRVFHTSHPPVVTAIFPTYEDHAVHRDARLGGHDFALGKKDAHVA
jgi:hypothetical protein